MAKKISDEIIAQIPILYEKYNSKKKVAEELGISTTSVTKYLNIYQGAPVEVVRKARVKIDDEMIKKINELFAAWRNMARVARELGISASTVKNHLSEENLQLKEKINDDRDALWFYIYRLFGPDGDKPVSDWNVAQMQKHQKEGMSYRSQLLTLKWWYEVKGNKVTEKYKTIGIIPYIYDQASAYYKSQDKRQKEIEEAIEKQLEKDRVEIKYNPSDYIGRKKRKQIDLNSIIGDDE